MPNAPKGVFTLKNIPALKKFSIKKNGVCSFKVLSSYRENGRVLRVAKV